MRTIQQVQDQLALLPETGLTAAQVERSRRLFGGNRLTPLPREPLWKKFLEKFDEPIIKILLAAALLSIVVDLFRVSWVHGAVAFGLVVAAVVAASIRKKTEWLPTLLFGLALLLVLFGVLVGHPSWEGLAVMVAVALATGVAFASEYKSDREFEILNTEKESHRVKVLRGGAFHTIPMEEVVVGESVVLEMGDEVPADGRVLKATELYIDQSLMTGESEPVHKQVRSAGDAVEGPDQPDCLYRGTQVVDGIGQMVVAEVGDATALGQIARRLAAVERDEPHRTDAAGKRVERKLTLSKELTPLQLKLQNLAGLISKVGYAAAVLIFIALLVRGILVGEVHWPRSAQDFLDVFGHLLGYFVYMVIIVVVAVPEGLPMSVTVSLALAMRKMTRSNSLVRQLVACETIGSATVICSDKTGTLTQNKMQVVRLSWDGESVELNQLVIPSSPPRTDALGSPLQWIILNAAVNSTANLEAKKGKLVPVGNSTEAALLLWLHELGVEHVKLRREFEPVYQVHFSSERKRMTTVIHSGGRLVCLVKGAPELVLARSTHFQCADGTAKPWTSEAKEKAERWLRDSAGQAMRALAFAHALLPEDTPANEDALHDRRDAIEANLVFAGFVAIRDPLRDDVKEAVASCRAAGIEVKMVTGDNVETARAIGYDIGLIERRDTPIDESAGAVMTSQKFNELTDDQLKEQLPRLRILARARPLDKYRLVKLLQELGEVVAVTGDGTNDAPALKKADVGLAMGIAGTEVAKEASKIVLLDDSFATIVKAVQWGRSLYENIQRFIQFQLTINVSALTIAFLGPFVGVKPPFTILQLLWINVIMDTLASIALCSEPPRGGVMRLPPKRRDENILNRSMVQTILATAGFFVVVMVTLLLLMEGTPGQPGWFAGDGAWSSEFPELTIRQVSLFFSIYVFFQVWNQINCRSLTPETSGFVNLLANPTFLTIGGLVALGQIVIVTFGGEIFKVEPLGVGTWLVVILATASVLGFAEAARRLRLAVKNC